MCCTTLTLLVYVTTDTDGDGEDGGGAERGKKATKPVTAVQDCISTSVSVTQLDHFKRTKGNIESFIRGQKAYVSNKKMEHLQLCL